MSLVENSKNKFTIRFRRTVDSDPCDVGFELDGFKLRWIRDRLQEDRIGRIWKPLQKSDLPESTLKELEKQRFGIWTGGNTIRRGDLVLAYAPIEAVNEQKQEIAERNQALKTLVRSVPKGMQPKTKVEYQQEVYGSADFEK